MAHSRISDNKKHLTHHMQGAFYAAAENHRRPSQWASLLRPNDRLIA